MRDGQVSRRSRPQPQRITCACHTRYVCDKEERPPFVSARAGRQVLSAAEAYLSAGAKG